jgi:hypothetical protein
LADFSSTASLEAVNCRVVLHPQIVFQSNLPRASTPVRVARDLAQEDNKMKKHLVFLLLLVVIGSLPLLLIGCERLSRNSTQSVPAQFATTTLAKPTALKFAKVQIQSTAPLRIVLLQDVSRSTLWTSTPRTNWADLEILISVVARRGGEIAVGLISNRPVPLVRVSLDPFLVEPPQSSETTRNPFIAAEQRSVYQRQLSAYTAERTRWQANTDERAAEFKRKVLPLLGQPADAPATDVWGALAQAELFLHEPQGGSAPAPDCFLVIASDGIDTVHRQPITLQSGTKVIVVTGAMGVGVLNRFNVTRFESPGAAVRWINQEVQ